MVHSLKKKLPMFIIREIGNFTRESGNCTYETEVSTSAKLEYAISVLGMKPDLFDDALGKRGDTCPICTIEYKETDYVFICALCGLAYHPMYFISGCMSRQSNQHHNCPMCLKEDNIFGVVEVKSMATVERVKFKKDVCQLYCQVLHLGELYDKLQKYIMEPVRMSDGEGCQSTGLLPYMTRLKCGYCEISKASFVLDNDKEKDNKNLEI